MHLGGPNELRKRPFLVVSGAMGFFRDTSSIEGAFCDIFLSGV